MTSPLVSPLAVSRLLALAAAGLMLAAAQSALGQAPPQPEAAVDPETGRDLSAYPPHRPADVEHIRLEVDIPDMHKPLVRCKERITLTPHAEAISSVPLNEVGLAIESVSSPRGGITYVVNPDSDEIEFTFDKALQLGEHADIDIAYSVNDPAEGLIWTLDAPGPAARPPLVYSQGEPESNRYWFIGPDFPNARFTSEIILVVPQGFTTCSNGALVEQATLPPVAPSTQAYERFHWRLDRPHANYLVSLAVSTFDVVDVGDSHLPMPVCVPKGQGDLVRASYSRTPQMVRLYERISGEPYPWPKYGQILVTNFAWGGMENTSATTLESDAILDKTASLDGDVDDLICHELSHQWFGDLITCHGWENIWLNEGFATYCEKLWAEYRDNGAIDAHSPGVAGLRADTAAYDCGIWTDYQTLIDADHADAPNQPAMVNNHYAYADDVFDQAANPYPKGSSVLHMLRVKLGDEVFFRAVASYVAHYKDNLAETFNLRREFEKAASVSLQRFFDQWCYRPGVPHIDVDMSWDSAASELVLKFKQSQPINGDNPAFFINTTISVRSQVGGEPLSFPVFFDTKSHDQRIKLLSPPVFAAINPRLESLADFRVEAPLDWTLAQLAAGPTTASRLLAAQTIPFSIDAPADRARVLEALEHIALDESAYYGIRSTAFKTIAALANPDSDDDDATPVDQDKDAAHHDTPSRGWPEAAAAFLHMIDHAKIADARARQPLVDSFGTALEHADAPTRERAVGILGALLSNDPSYGVRAAAVSSLARMRTQSAVLPVLAALSVDSRGDRIRQAAVRALTRLPAPGRLDIAVRMTEPEHYGRTRAAAAETLAKLQREEPDKALAVLTSLTHDRELDVSIAAIRSLGRLPDPRAARVLTDLAQSSPSRAARSLAKQTLESPNTATP